VAEKPPFALESPSPEEVLEEVAPYLHGTPRYPVVIAGLCTARYEGRASSKAGPAVRIAICKPDGTFILHNAMEKREPTNWNPAPSVQKLRVEDGNLILVSKRLDVPETVIVTFEDVHAAMVLPRSVGDSRASNAPSAFTISRTHEEMVRYILEDPSRIDPSLLPPEGSPARHTEVECGAGIADVVLKDEKGRLVVIEVKRARADINAAAQLKRYVDAFREERGESVRGILVAPDVTEGCERYLRKYGLEWRRLRPEDVERAEKGPTLDDFLG